MTRTVFVKSMIGAILSTRDGANEVTATKNLLRYLKEKSTKVVCVSVIHVADDIRTSITVTPHLITNFPGAYRKKTWDTEVVKRAIGAAMASKPTEHGMFADIRWSIEYLDENQNPIQIIYLAGTQLDGYVGNVPVAFADNTLLSFLQSYFDRE